MFTGINWQTELTPLGYTRPRSTGLFPTTLYVATRLNGVYYTNTFTQPSDATQPTWTAVNGGLGALTVTSFGLDPFDKAGRQLCLTGLAGDAYIRYGAGNWIVILTLAQLRLATAVDTVFSWITADRSVAGRVWVFAYRPNIALSPIMYCGYTDDDGVGWTWLVDAGGTLAIRLGGVLIASGNELWKTYNDSAAGNGKVSYTANLGGAWVRSTTLGGSAWKPPVFVNALAGTQYVNGNGANGPDLVNVTTAMALTVLQDGLDIGPRYVQSMWFSVNLPNYQRIMRANTLHVTTDAWVNVTSYPFGGFNGMDYVLAPRQADETQMITATILLAALQDHHIYTLDGDAAALVGKSGSDPAGGVNSIPKAAGGVISGGIGVVA